MSVNQQQESNSSTIEELFEKHPIGDTPFWVIGTKESYSIIMGKFIVVEHEFKTVEEAINYIDEKPWELLVKVTGIIVDELKNK